MLDDDSKTFTYSIDEGPGPLADGQMQNYVGRVVVEHIAGGTRVEWTSNWQENDEAIYEFCHPIYLALLDDMKASIEG